MSTPSSDPQSTPSIPIHSSLTSSSPSLPTSNQQALISHLTQTSSLSTLASTLSDAFARSGWTDRVQALARELLRNGTCSTFPELLVEVKRRAALPRDAEAQNGTTMATTNGTTKGGDAQGNTKHNGEGSIVVAKEWTSGPEGLPDVRVPASVVEIGVDFVRERLGEVCEVVDD